MAIYRIIFALSTLLIFLFAFIDLIYIIGNIMSKSTFASIEDIKHNDA
jgi:hypothetical protein